MFWIIATGCVLLAVLIMSSQKSRDFSHGMDSPYQAL